MTPEQAVTKWQPIETAPKDGTRVLGYSPEFGYDTPVCVAMIWDKHERGWFADQYDSAGKINPTHWVSLPPLPPEAP